MKGLSFLMWNFILIHRLVLKIYRENLKISAITGRLPVIFNLLQTLSQIKDSGFVTWFCYFNGMLREAEVELVESGSIIVSEMQSKKGVIHTGNFSRGFNFRWVRDLPKNAKNRHSEK